MPEHKTKNNATSAHTLLLNHKAPNQDEEANSNLSLSLFGQVLCYFLFSDMPGGLPLLPTPITTLIRGTIWFLPAPFSLQPTVAAMTISPGSLWRQSIAAVRIVFGRRRRRLWRRIIGTPSSSLFPTLTTHYILLKLLCWEKREHKVTIILQFSTGRVFLCNIRVRNRNYQVIIKERIQFLVQSKTMRNHC